MEQTLGIIMYTENVIKMPDNVFRIACHIFLIKPDGNLPGNIGVRSQTIGYLIGIHLLSHQSNFHAALFEFLLLAFSAGSVSIL